MQVPFVDLKSQYHQIKAEVVTAIEQVLEGGQYIGGVFVRDFEEVMASHHHVKHFVGCANGSDALYLALKAAGIGSGDEVLTTAFSWIATAHAISLTGATPVFVDIDLSNYQMDLQLASDRIISKTKAMVPVYLYGDASTREATIAFAKKHNLALIEDAAQVHGLPLPIDSELDFHIVCTSYYPTKQHGAYGDAGGLWTDSSELKEKIVRYANQGALFPEQDYRLVGINSRLDPIQAAILGTKLEYLESWWVQRIEIAQQYLDRLNGEDAVALPTISEMHTLYQFVIRVPDRDQLRDHLDKVGIGSGVHYSYTLPGTAVYGSQIGFHNAELAAGQVISLPCYPGLTSEQVDYVCDQLKTYYS